LYEVPGAALAAFLALPELAGRWTVAAYVADASAGMTEAEQDEERFRDPGLMHGMSRQQSAEEEEEEVAARKVIFARGKAADARQFLRARFQPAFTPGSKSCDIYLTTPRMAREGPLLTHAEAFAVDLNPPPVVVHQPEPRGVDKELLECVTSRLNGCMSLASRQEQGALLAEVDAAKARGGDVQRSGALHAAASGHLPAAVLTQLVARGGDVNGKNHSGLTPLMYAAGTALGRVSRYNPVPDSTTVATLIALSSFMGRVG